MNNVQVQPNSGGVGFLGLLTLLFIGLKLGGVITWSWWYVLMPMWLPLLVGVGIIGLIGLIAGIVHMVRR